MSGLVGGLIAMLVAANALGVGHAAAWYDRSTGNPLRSSTLRAGIALGLVLVGIGLLAAPLLSVLDVSTHTFRLAAAAVVGISGAKWMLAPTKPIDHVADNREAGLTLSTLVLTPAPVLMALAVNSEAGTVGGLVAAGATGAATVTALATRRLPPRVSDALVRFVGALGIVVGVIVGLDSARSV